MSTENIRIRCKKCGHLLPPDASFCDNCGEPVKKQTPKPEAAKKRVRRNNKLAVAIVISLFVIAIAFALPFIINSVNTPPPGDDEESYEDRFVRMSSRVTAEQYDQIDFGMSYQDVKAIIGEDGTEYYGDLVWPGKYYDKEMHYYDAPRLELTFSDNDKLIEIKEFNLLDGEEIYNAPNDSEVEAVNVNEEILSEMRSRMSYEEIVEIIGAPGVLIEAESNKNGTSSKKVYKWKYIMEGEEKSYDKFLTIAFYNGKADKDRWSIWGQY